VGGGGGGEREKREEKKRGDGLSTPQSAMGPISTLCFYPLFFLFIFTEYEVS